MTLTSLLTRRPLRQVVFNSASIVAVVSSMGVAAASGMPAGGGLTPQANSIQSVIHILGIVSSLLLGYYGYRARERYKGGALASAATYVIVGALLFALAFLVEELNHGLSINVFEPVGDMQLQMALSMFLFTGTVFAFGWAFYGMTTDLKEWYS